VKEWQTAVFPPSDILPDFLDAYPGTHGEVWQPISVLIAAVSARRRIILCRSFKSTQTPFLSTQRPNPLLCCSHAIWLDYILHVPNRRKSIAPGRFADPAKPQAIFTGVPMRPFCKDPDALPFHDDKRSPGMSHTNRLFRRFADCFRTALYLGATRKC
jgi:hypothetical protein